MDFDLSEEQELLQASVGDLLENECPLARVHAIYDEEADVDAGLWRRLGELGLLGTLVPEAYGGAELGLLDTSLVAEVLGYGAAPVPFLGHALATLAVALGGGEAQKERWLPALATGEVIGAVAFAEPEGRWHPDEWQLAPEPTLSGRKLHVAGGAQADLLVVGLGGGRLGLVAGTQAGLKCIPEDGIDRTRPLAEVIFERCPCDELAGGSAISGRIRDAALVLLAADAFGGATRCVEMAVDYARQREQFGVTIGHFQGLKHQLADMALSVEPLRALYWYAAHAFDAIPAAAPRAAALAFATLTDTYVQVGRDATEAHGGIGFTWEGDVHIWLKRGLFDRAMLGGPTFQRERCAQLAGWP
ncbi:MAG: acyl-CoA/acyl-ACP dehydrogenase [Proteobacteria bacterium]|nr:acyl-CoA/acyl-ACP dehydrogenase [Pseudomonadota bacterium]